MGFDYCLENEQYLTPLVEGLVEPTHYYGITKTFFHFHNCDQGLLIRQVEFSVQAQRSKTRMSSSSLAFCVSSQARSTFTGPWTTRSLVLS
jgi:hypothetical protein